MFEIPYKRYWTFWKIKTNTRNRYAAVTLCFRNFLMRYRALLQVQPSKTEINEDCHAQTRARLTASCLSSIAAGRFPNLGYYSTREPNLRPRVWVPQQRGVSPIWDTIRGRKFCHFTTTGTFTSLSDLHIDCAHSIVGGKYTQWICIRYPLLSQRFDAFHATAG